MDNYECKPGCKAMQLLVLGIILILATLYTNWNIGIVLGVLVIIKAVLIMIIPVCPCKTKKRR